MTTAVDGSEALLQLLYRAPIGLIQTALDGAVEMMNPMSARLLMPVTPDGRLDNLFDVLARVAPQLRARVEAFDGDGGVVCDGLRFEVAGRDRRSVLAVSVLKIDGARLMIVLADATDEALREEAEIARRLDRAARVDALTRMPNRVAIAELMRATLRAPTSARGRVALLMVGCERLAEIAESFGGDVRDEVVELMARRLRSVLRSDDDLTNLDGDRVAARIGGDEFVVFLRALRDPADATSVAQRVLDALGKPYAVGTRALHCAVSVGVVHGDAGGRSRRAAARRGHRDARGEAGRRLALDRVRPDDARARRAPRQPRARPAPGAGVRRAVRRLPAGRGAAGRHRAAADRRRRGARALAPSGARRRSRAGRVHRHRRSRPV